MEKALLLTDPPNCSEVGKLAKLLAFLGVSTQQATIAEFPTIAGAGDHSFRLFCSTGTFLELATNFD